jgi:integrase
MKDSELRKLPYQKEASINRGLRVRKNKDDSCSWILQARMKGAPAQASPKRTVLGIWPDMTWDQAEAKASHYRSLLRDGIDPIQYEKNQRRKAEAKALEEKAKQITLQKLLDEYHLDRQRVGKGNSRSYLRGYRSATERVFKRFLDTPIHDIRGPDLREEYHCWNSQRISPRTGKPAKSIADMAVVHLRTLWNHAMKRMQIIDTNPVDVFHGEIQRPPPSEYFLKPREAVQVFDVIKEICDMAKLLETTNTKHDDPKYKNLIPQHLGEWAFTEEANVQYNAIALTLLSGLRGPSEVLTLPWSKVFLDKEDWEDDTPCPYFHVWTKQKREFGVPITSPMEAIFREQRRKKRNDYVFPSPSPKRKNLHIESARKAYVEVLTPLVKSRYTNPNTKRLGARVMRHTFATACDHLFHDLSLADKITGHGPTTKTSTRNYIHRSVEDNFDYFKKINSLLTGAMDKIPDNWDRELEETYNEPDFPIVEGGYVNPDHR